MRFVLDASVTVAWAMPDEGHPLAENAFEELGQGSAIVPAIWWFEIRNILLLSERRGRISCEDRVLLLHKLKAFTVDIAALGDGITIMDIAQMYRLTVYDAAYLELAQREQVPLATLDKALQASARSAGIPLLA